MVDFSRRCQCGRLAGRDGLCSPCRVRKEKEAAAEVEKGDKDDA